MNYLVKITLLFNRVLAIFSPLIHQLITKLLLSKNNHINVGGILLIVETKMGVLRTLPLMRLNKFVFQIFVYLEASFLLKVYF
ncbi:Uncharacterised protein [Legionella bozemanae]|uniref:Uncharacterized protein n=1 Tax=Legionella bozemanae TaxID=447 RepID=A0A0W0RDN3_LEGBO|nr:hypothetical protein Lboz_3332 [Legionella bozemanae]STO32919.1 Uncharacterised protein [Legionella bozemanae]